MSILQFNVKKKHPCFKAVIQDLNAILREKRIQEKNVYFDFAWNWISKGYEVNISHLIRTLVVSSSIHTIKRFIL